MGERPFSGREWSLRRLPGDQACSDEIAETGGEAAINIDLAACPFDSLSIRRNGEMPEELRPVASADEVLSPESLREACGPAAGRVKMMSRLGGDRRGRRADE
jgi:hypothetical protein